jgi:hypothetical protein
MTKNWESLTPRQQAAAYGAFDALATMDRLADLENADRPEPVSFADFYAPVGFADIYAYVVHDEPDRDRRVAGALERSPGLRADADRLLRKTALHHFPRAAAASSGALTGRQGNGFKLRLRPSRANPAHVYVIIDVALDKTPGALFVCGDGRHYQKHALPEARNGTIQILAEADSDLIRALSDNATEVFLK